MRRVGAIAIAVGGLATALLDVLLCLTLLGDVMRAEGAGFLAWMAVLVLSGCFLVAVAIVLLHCAADWGWCWPGWGLGLLYLLLVAEELWGRSGAYGSPAPMVLVCSYLTTIPFQLAVWARHTAAPPSRRKPERRPVQWPRTVRRLLVLLALRSALLVLRAVRLAQQRRSAALAEESPSSSGWNSVANRR
ncbi:hypothetical protein ABGB12_30930 [Actinocorallia sp. B10E7]|uniref:hypothetical protein n=1 Tax=Actinocorallia sp. B10E7 TaxID=3153558 RepID=UPI00325E9A08